MISLGLDLGGSAVKAVRMRGRDPIARATSSRYTRPDADTLRRALAEVASALGVRHGEHRGPVGLSVPGIIDPATGRIAIAVNLPGLVGLDLDDAVGRALGLDRPDRLLVMADPVASAYGAWVRDRRPGRTLALVLGTGVGAAVLDDGHPLHVDGVYPGHIGQLDVGPCPPLAPLGPDGGRHSLEGYLGAPALRERLGDDPVAGLLAAPIHDPAYVALARAIRICIAIYRPHHVLLLGGIGTRLGPRLADLDGLIRHELTGVARPGWTLGLGHADDLGADGAAIRAADLSTEP